MYVCISMQVLGYTITHPSLKSKQHRDQYGLQHV